MHRQYAPPAPDINGQIRPKRALATPGALPDKIIMAARLARRFKENAE
jgi:hypothetical protein